MRDLIIENHRISDDSDCFVIAEIGHNHQGELDKAKELIRRAKDCGVDAVKVQKRDNRSLYTKEMYHKPYENEHSFGRTYGEHREFLEFGWDEYVELKRYCREIGVLFFASVFDFSSADFLAKLDMPVYKIASGDLKNLALIKYVAQFGKPLLVSTGGGTMEDVERVYDAVMPFNTQLCIMQCTASYPTQPEDIHLRVIQTFRDRFPDIPIGFSDHYNGIAMAVAAYVLGARVLEKHFTLNHTWKGTDHALSLEPIGMQKMVRDLRRVRLALGVRQKKFLLREETGHFKMGKKLVAARDLVCGHILTKDDIAIKSPGDGLPPYELERLIGQRLAVAVKADADIHFDLLDVKADAKLLRS